MKTAIAIINNRPQLLSIFVVVVLMAMVGTYIYLLSLTVVHVVMRKEADRDISRLHSEISSLEADYMVAQHRISTEITDRTDLSATNEKIFLTKKEPDLVLSSIQNR